MSRARAAVLGISIAIAIAFFASAPPAAGGEPFIRGDANMDGTVDISDPVATLEHLFLGGDHVRNRDAADTNDSGTLDLTDAVYDFVFLFMGYRSPRPPFPTAGYDPTPDDWSDGDFYDAVIVPYCVTATEADGISGILFTLELVWSSPEVEFWIPEHGIEATGTRIGDTATATFEIPGAGTATLTITVPGDGATLTGTLVGAGMDRTLEGILGFCPEAGVGEPQCILPVSGPERPLVTAGQQWRSVSGGTVHRGLDFGFARPEPAEPTVLIDIAAPCDGVVREIRRHQLATGRWRYSVVLRHGWARNVLLGFEPDSPEMDIVERQGKELAVSLGQVLERGDLVGRLVVAGLPAPDPAAYVPHLHWGMYVTSSETDDACPAEFLIPAEAAALDALYGSLPGTTPGSVLLPVCLE